MVVLIDNTSDFVAMFFFKLINQIIGKEVVADEKDATLAVAEFEEMALDFVDDNTSEGYEYDAEYGAVDEDEAREGKFAFEEEVGDDEEEPDETE